MIGSGLNKGWGHWAGGESPLVIVLAMFLKVSSIFEVHLSCFPRQRLENDLRVKENSISIDQSKCMTLRFAFWFGFYDSKLITDKEE